MSEENKKIRPEKQAMYAEVRTTVSRSPYMLLADYKGMTMSEIDEFKKLLRNANARVSVVKNSMLGRIGEEMGLDLWKTLVGPTGVIFGAGDVVEVAKIVKKFSGDKNKLAAKGGVLEGAVLSAQDVMALAGLPRKKELQAKLVGTIAAPMAQLVGVMGQKVCSLLYVLNAVVEKKKQAA